MSSAVLSPHTASLPIPEATAGRRGRRAPYRESHDRISASPVPTAMSTSTIISTRSRQRISRSVSTAEASPEKQNIPLGSSRKGKEKATVTPPEAIAEKQLQIKGFEEEGEPELDISDTITVNGHEASSASSEKASEKPEVEEAPCQNTVVLLAIGKKRKPPPVDEEEKLDDERMEVEDDLKGDGAKRMGRKKRKWLKKGEGAYPCLVQNATLLD